MQIVAGAAQAAEIAREVSECVCLYSTFYTNKIQYTPNPAAAQRAQRDIVMRDASMWRGLCASDLALTTLWMARRRKIDYLYRL